jgi:hypothetical protein
MGHPLQITGSASQSADCRNWLTAILLIAGISFLLQFERISNEISNFCYRPMVGSLLQIQITELVSSRKCSKIISHECELAFCYQFFAAGFLWMGISHIFMLKPLKPVFYI